MTKVDTIFGLWDQQTFNSIKSEISKTKCDYLVNSTIGTYVAPVYKKQFFFSKKLVSLGKIDIHQNITVLDHYEPKKFVPLDKYLSIPEKQNDVNLKNQIIAKIYVGFQAVTQTTQNASKNIRLLSLHPSNVLVKEDLKGNKKVISIKFAKYLPQVYYESIVMKDERINQGYQLDNAEELKYISPRILNTNGNITFKGKKGITKGVEMITLEDSYYSLGCLFAYIDSNGHAFDRVSFDRIMTAHYNDRYEESIIDSMSSKTIQQFVGMMLNFSPIKDIANAQYVSTINNNLVPIEIDPNDLEFIEKLGAGAFATLFKCLYTDEKRKQTIVAVKQFDLKQDGIRMEQIYVEYEMMALCNCPNSVKVKGIVNCKKSIDPEVKRTGDYVYILMECCDLGSLDKFVSKHWHHGQIPKEFTEHVFIEMLWGLFYLHSHRCIVHRDIKPENTLLMSNPHHPEKPYIKLSDLGVSKMIMSDDEAPRTFAGTKQYMAPEIQNPGVGDTYTYKIDLWSFAVTMYQLVTFNYALGMRDSKATIHCQYKIDVLFKEDIWSEYGEMKEVLQHLFVYDYDERWGWPELFRSKYVQSLLFKRKKRMLEEVREGNVVDDEYVRKEWEREYAAIASEDFQKLYKIAYKK